jgi:hypothetical protein
MSSINLRCAFELGWEFQDHICVLRMLVDNNQQTRGFYKKTQVEGSVCRHPHQNSHPIAAWDAQLAYTTARVYDAIMYRFACAVSKLTPKEC